MHKLAPIGTIAMLLMATLAWGQDQVRWVADFRQACEMAAEQRRLVLLHFYSDDCPPCVKVDQNVFSQADVAAAIDRNYIGVKVHVKKTPQLAMRYQVRQWPTDVIVSPSGLEVFRTVSPQSKNDYIALMDQVAQQAGSSVAQSTATPGSAAGASPYVQQAPNGMTNSPYGQQTPAANMPAMQAGYGQPAGGATATSPAAAPYGQSPIENTTTTRSSFQPVAETQMPAGGSMYGAAPAPTGPYAQPAAPQDSPYAQNPYVQPSPQPGYGEQPAQQPYGQQQYAAQPAPQQPMNNRYAGGEAQAAGGPYGPSQPQMQQQPAPQYSQQAYAPQQPQPQYSQQGVMTNPYAQQAPQPAPQQAEMAARDYQPAGSVMPVSANPPISPAQNQFVAAVDAPKLAMDGYCVVTLLEGGKWTKGNPQWGAVHRGRTYLFTTEAEQQKFLADPDRFSPMLSGCDPVIFAQTGQLVEGKRSFGLTYRKQLFLFTEAAARDAFERSPETFAGNAYQAMMQVDTTLR